MTPDQPNEVDQTKPQARGHLIRTGHKLTGYYVATPDAGIVRLVRTCECATSTALPGDQPNETIRPIWADRD